jgi:hypothetical protein
MEELLLFGLLIPVTLFLGWLAGISAWRQVRKLREEVAVLRRALLEAGIAVPDAAAAADRARWTPPAAAAKPGRQPEPLGRLTPTACRARRRVTRRRAR